MKDGRKEMKKVEKHVEIRSYDVEVFRIVNQKKRYKVLAFCPEDAIQMANTIAMQDHIFNETPFISDIKEKKDGND
jgi:hypothetical protein